MKKRNLTLAAIIMVAASNFLTGVLQTSCFAQNQYAGTKEGSKNKIAQNPFGTNVFVENLGQFNMWVEPQNTGILYGVNNGDIILFSGNSLIFKMDKSEKRTNVEEEISDGEKMTNEKYEESEKKKYVPKNYYVHLEWAGSNKNVSVEGKDKVNRHYTFGEKGYEQIQAKGYQQLLYRNLYKGVDVEYYVPGADSNGIKYKVIIHPDGDYRSIRMQYAGDVKGISINNQGEAEIESTPGIIVDHAPYAYYLESGKPVPVKFAKDEIGLYFDFPETLEKNQTVIIDPWIVVPTSLTTNTRAYDVDFDDYGNVFISGGDPPGKIAKYDGNGSLLWTYTIPVIFASSVYHTEFGLIRKSGSVFVGQGVGSPAEVVKINSSGTQVFSISTNSGLNSEIWTIFHNPCNGKMLVFGGGTSVPQNLYLSSDTNLTSFSTINFNGAASNCCNDVADAIIDNNGDFYGLTVSNNPGNQSNFIHKSLQSSGHNPPTGFSLPSGYFFAEAASIGIFSLLSYSNRINALALNTNYLFTYDGQTLNAWNKTNGTQLGSIIVNAGYAAGFNRTHEGIAADDCNNVYVGGSSMVHVYSFNGTTFSALPSITTNIPNEVYDVMLDEGRGIIYACGNGFLSSITALPCNSFSITATINSCSVLGSATVTPAGGIPPYTYLWSNGATTSAVSNLTSGTYTVMIWDGSCTKKTTVNTITISSGTLPVTINSASPLCNGGSGSATANSNAGTGPYTYSWNTTPAQTSQTATGLLIGTTYTVIMNDASGCVGTQTVAVTQPTAITPSTSVTSANCGSSTGTASVNASGGTGTFTYLWNPSSQSTQTATGLGAGTYTVLVTDANSCTQTATAAITQTGVLPVTINSANPLCNGGSGSATANSGAGSGPYTYSWNTTPVQTSQTATGLSISTFTVIMTDASGCLGTQTVAITQPAAITASTTITSANCGNNTGTASVNASGGTGAFTYLWNPSSQTLQTATGLGAGNYTVTITDANACPQTATATITQTGGPTVIPSSTPQTCTQLGTATASTSGGTSPYTYQWCNGATTSSATGLSAGSCTVTVTDANGCPTLNTLTITSSVNIPSVSPSSTPANCGINNGTATATVNGGTLPYSYLWSNGQTTSTATGLGAGTYSVLVTAAGGCTQTAATAVTQPSGPTATAASNITITQGQSVTLTAGGGGTYLWSNGQTNNPLMVAPSVTTIYCVTVTDASNCEDTACVKVTIEVEPLDCSSFSDPEDFYIPNAFSPNSDNENDIVKLFYGNMACIKTYKFTIYNRWGEKVFETEKPLDAWDGSYKGKAEGTAAFVWYMNAELLNGEKIQRKGNVSLIQ